MASALELMYKEMILEHSTRPRNKGELTNANSKEIGENPSCGDRIEIFLQLQNNTINQIRFTGIGCSISQASASMMTQLMTGKTIESAKELLVFFHDMLQGHAPSEALGDAVALQGVSKLHARVKCASLAWQTLELALQQNKPA